MFTLPMLLACVALAASLIMTRHRPLVFPVVAVVVSAVEVLMAFGLVHISVARLPLGLILGAVLVVAGVAVYAKTQAKSSVAAATAVALVGAMQILSSLHIH